MAEQILVIPNFDTTNVAEQAELSADALTGQAVVSVVNADGIAVNSYLLLGTPGSENSDLVQVQSISGNDLTLTANLDHKKYKGDKVLVLKANQFRVYRAANVDGSIPLDASFSLLATSSIQEDQVNTEYTDTNGGSGYWYKFTYYNSTSGSESALANATAVRGGNYGYYTTVEEVRKEAGLQNNRFITDADIFRRIVNSQSEVNASLAIAGYSLPLTTVPSMVNNITTLLAAGYILLTNQGPEYEGTNKEGNAKLKMAKDMLKQLETTNVQLIDDVNANAGQADGIAGYPDNNAEFNTPSEARAFSMTDNF